MRGKLLLDSFVESIGGGCGNGGGSCRGQHTREAREGDNGKEARGRGQAGGEGAGEDVAKGAADEGVGEDGEVVCVYVCVCVCVSV